jgi:hypothetical protein
MGGIQQMMIVDIMLGVATILTATSAIIIAFRANSLEKFRDKQIKINKQQIKLNKLYVEQLDILADNFESILKSIEHNREKDTQR